MSIGKIIGSGVAIALGVFFVIYGGYDDSPGAQGLGLVAIVIGIVLLIKRGRNEN